MILHGKFWLPPKCLIQKSPCQTANGNFCASGAHVHLSTLRSGSRNHHFRHGLPLFDSDTRLYWLNTRQITSAGIASE
ncbi:hypothetical protein F9K88_20175 [Brucella intermedia]|nr:hypothetical protein F9K88_20175 [Brucella intermedia]KAB2715426.1 hypothetical protein F9K75_19225 [Brucella intermedia]PJT27586.1 hypothetical protein CN884_04165 [Ochrobactrum sp. 30A/1000/2015]PJT36462.1 hypothetical protein CN883_22675 [Ochrobactrum sp. 27A/999/2015]PJT41262.1 hypothetical protein CN882_22935 [Ochrobactrum sp. 23A/997/2015]